MHTTRMPGGHADRFGFPFHINVEDIVRDVLERRKHNRPVTRINRRTGGDRKHFRCSHHMQFRHVELNHRTRLRGGDKSSLRAASVRLQNKCRPVSASAPRPVASLPASDQSSIPFECAVDSDRPPACQAASVESASSPPATVKWKGSSQLPQKAEPQHLFRQSAPLPLSTNRNW